MLVQVAEDVLHVSLWVSGGNRNVAHSDGWYMCNAKVRFSDTHTHTRWI